MLNVAVSRAKDSFLVIGNLALLDRRKPSRPSGLLASRLFHDAWGATLAPGAPLGLQRGGPASVRASP